MKKFLGILLVVSMLLGMIPVVSAADTDATTWTKVTSLAEIGQSDTFAITITVGGNTYVLPVVAAAKAAESTAVPEITGSVDGNTLTVTNTDYAFGWTLVPAEGGYHIKSGEYYLFVANSNNGIRIANKTPDATFVWNILSCGLLGASEGTSYRTLCVDNTLASPQWGTYPTANKGTDGQANSKVRDNVLGLWKLNTGDTHTCEDVEPKDHKCDTCGEVLSQCADTDPLDHNCDICGTALSECADAAGDGDHKCDVCDKEAVTDHTDDPADGDHICDECADYEFGHADEDNDKFCDDCKAPLCGDDHLDVTGDGDHKCDRCGVDEVTACADADTDTDHNCDECGKEDITDHVWTDATYDAPKTCSVCGKTEGEPLPKPEEPAGIQWTKVSGLADIGETDTFAITITVGGNTYVLPVVESGNSTGSQKVPEITGSVDGSTLTTNTEYSFGWTLVPTEGGYHIKSGDYYLYVSASNNGLLIYKKNPTTSNFVWNILSCGLLGASEGTSYRTLCVDNTLASPQWGTYPTANKGLDGQANSKVRDNVLGLWKLNTGDTHTCEDVEPKDHKCDTCGEVLSQCADAAGDGDHKCDICDQDGITDHTDDPADGDHKCDECADYEFSHVDEDNDKICDDCKAPLCGDEHLDDPADGDHKCDRCGMDDVTDCKDASGDGNHNCDDCGKENITDCTDSDTDTDHDCDECGKENLNSCVDSDTDTDHNCDICGKEDITDHVWTDATYDAPKTCTVCGKTEGEPLVKPEVPEGSYWVKVSGLADIGENDLLAIAITIDGTTYVLPTAYISSGAHNTSLQGTVSGGTYLTVEGAEVSGYGWKVIPTEGGYHIKSGSNYLWVDTMDKGLRITDTSDPSVWNVLSCGLLGASDAAGNYRTMCVRDNQWNSFKTSGGAVDGNSHSSVRSNELTLFKYVSTDDPSGGEGGEGGEDTKPEVPENAYWEKVSSLADIGHGGMFAITITIDGITYVLPTTPVYSNAGTPSLWLQGTVSADGHYMTVGDGTNHDICRWILMVTDGGYLIRSGNNFLWLDVVDTGLRISQSGSPTVWNVLKNGFLGASDVNSNWRVLCIRDGLWKTLKTSGNSMDGNAHSTVRNNQLGLWKFMNGDAPLEHFCFDLSGDGDHICEECGKDNASPCSDVVGDKDHRCDECGKYGVSKCGDKTGDGNHSCDECGAYNVTNCKDSDYDMDHRCDECWKDGISAHKWLDPTFEKPMTCTVCGTTKGDPLTEAPDPEESHWIKVSGLEEIGPEDKFAITISIDGTLYILPNTTVASNKNAPTTSSQAVLSSDHRYMNIATGGSNSTYNWKLVAVDGGYNIVSEEGNYLWVDTGDKGIRITGTNDPAVWNILKCGLLGAADADGKYRVICIRDGVWCSFKTVGNTAYGNAHTTVRSNVLGIWKYVPLNEDTECDPCSDTIGDGDHNCDNCGAENVSDCIDSEYDNDHTCDDCGKENVSDCVDDAKDGDHNCDICGKEDVSQCSDGDADNTCDECGKALETQTEEPEKNGSPLWWIILLILAAVIGIAVFSVVKKKKD